MDKKKAKYYWELAAINGDLNARHNLGCMEGKTASSKGRVQGLVG